MLTAKQQQTYNFIRRYIQENDIAPTESEIAAGIGIKSRGVVHRYVSALAVQGYLEVVPNRRRNIRLLVQDEDDGGDWTLPIIGKIAAGQPIEALDQHRTFDIQQQLLGHGRFILEVSGDSMIGDNICDGDLIVCEQAQAANQSDIAVALIDGSDATLKRIHNNGDGTVTLIPSNPTLTPMVYPADRVQVQGRYLGLLRLVK